MGDLYLWKGNYPLASKYYRILLNYNGGDPIANNDSYAWNTLGSNGPQLETSGDSWMKIFAEAHGARVQNNENINIIPFDKNFAPGNPFVNLYAEENTYKIKPSAKAIANWSSQTRSDGSPGDVTRGISGNGFTRSAFKSYGNISRPFIYKLLPNYNKLAPFETSGKWIISRAGVLHLRFAESANRDGRDSLAYAFLNRGLRTTYTPKTLPDNPNRTFQQQSYDTNRDYYFDARQGNNPRFQSLWGYTPGMRGRAGLNEVTVDSALYFDMSIPGKLNKPFKPGAIPAFRNAMETLFINEGALELAFEGHRWQDLIRIALRREKEAAGTGREFLKNTVAAKFTAAGKAVPAGVNKLGDDVKNWYLPFNF
jgi:hypothetical protein